MQVMSVSAAVAVVSVAAWAECTGMLIIAATLLPKQDAKEAAAGSTTPAAGFGFGFASGSNNPFAALTSSSKTGGFGGFGGFGSAQPSKAGDTPAGDTVDDDQGAVPALDSWYSQR